MAILVPTRSAASQLRRTAGQLRVKADDSKAVPCPELLTRSEWYIRLHAALPEAPPWASPVDREVLMGGAARDSAAAGVGPPFRLRPGLIPEILALYDALRRNHRTVDRFAGLLEEECALDAEIDRGAARMLRQTRFLAATFRTYEARVQEAGVADEHVLRTLLLGREDLDAFQHVVVTVADQAADPDGLWIADFDLLARLAGVKRLDIVATERLLSAGFHERLHQHLPGIDEQRFTDIARARPTLLVPPGGDARYFTARDREEELVDAARRIKADHRSRPAPACLEHTAIVCKRPLPYVYLARRVFSGAGIPFETLDTMLLAA
jgi:hypothetical protein